jgi:hypothetical protein
MLSNRQKLMLIFVGLTMSIPFSEGCAMSFLKKWVVFSEVKGVVLDNGKPVPGVVVERFVMESNQEGLDSTVTDARGKFSFKSIEKTSFSISRLFPHEVVITQKLFINSGNYKYKAWICVKRNYENNGELNGKPIDIICDLKNDYIDNNGKFMGMCRLT